MIKQVDSMLESNVILVSVCMLGLLKSEAEIRAWDDCPGIDKALPQPIKCPLLQIAVSLPAVYACTMFHVSAGVI